MKNPMKFKHKTPLQIRFNDVDIAGHINNAVYQEYFDFGKLKYFQEVLGDQVDWKKEGLVLASITIDYFVPVLLQEELVLFTKVESFGNKSFKMHQEIWDSSLTELKCKAVSSMVCFDFTRQSTITIPDLWRIRMMEFETSTLNNA